MKSQGSLQCSREPATESYPESNEFRTYPHTLLPDDSS